MSISLETEKMREKRPLTAMSLLILVLLVSACAKKPHNFVDRTAEDFLDYGVVAHNRGELETALKIFSLAIQSNKLEGPVLARAYFDRGNVHHDMDDAESAMDDYNTALGINPQFADAYFNRAVCFREKNELDRALEDYRMSMALNPDDELAHNNMGYVYFRKGEYELAVKEYSRAIELRPEYARAYGNRAFAWLALGREDLARKDAEKAGELNPKIQRPTFEAKARPDEAEKDERK